jgi:hypothetical protein
VLELTTAESESEEPMAGTQQDNGVEEDECQQGIMTAGANDIRTGHGHQRPGAELFSS